MAFNSLSPEAIIFDKDGTLLSFFPFWEPVSRAAISEILAKYSASSLLDTVMYDGGFNDGKIDIRGVLCYGTYEDISAFIGDKLRATGIEFSDAELDSDTKAAFEASIGLGAVAPTSEGLDTVLLALRGNGVKLFLVTTDRIKSTMAALRALKIESLFDEIITGDYFPPKPDPAVINFLVDKYELDRDRMIMVGDSLTDIEFARNGGIIAVGLAEGEENRAILEKSADAVISEVVHIFDLIERPQDTAP